MIEEFRRQRNDQLFAGRKLLKVVNELKIGPKDGDMMLCSKLFLIQTKLSRLIDELLFMSFIHAFIPIKQPDF